MGDGISETIDAFHRGRFHIIQPKGRGHRAGMDAMLLASLVADERACRIADLGAGAGACGHGGCGAAGECRGNAVRTLAGNGAICPPQPRTARECCLSARVSVREADVTLRAKARAEAGLPDDHFHHVIMNPPYNDAGDRRTPDALKAEAHAMTDGLFEDWIRTAGAIMVPGGQLSLISRPQSVAEIIAACGSRFGGLEITLIHPRPGEDAVRMLVTAIKGSRARLAFRAPLIMHETGSHAFTPSWMT